MSRQSDADARALDNDHSGYDAADARRPLPDRLGDARDREGGRTS